MSSDQGPSSINQRTVFRAGIAGLILAGIGVGLFILTWDVLGSFDVPDAPRLFAAICMPPAGIAAIIGAYLLAVRPAKSTSDAADSSTQGDDTADGTESNR